MATLQDIRAQHPEYNDISDQDLADKLHAKFYSDMPREQFNEKLGLGVKDPNAVQNAMNPIERLASNIDAGGAQFGASLLNAPRNIVNRLSPALANKLPSFPTGGESAAYGISNPNMADKLIQGASQYAPYVAVSAALPSTGLLNATQTGAIFGGTQSANPLLGTAMGALTGLVSEGIPQLATSSAAPIKNFLSQFAAPGLQKTVAGTLEDAKGATNQDAFDLAKDNLEKTENAENEKWDTVDALANQADQIGIKFNDEGYNNALQQQKQKLSGQSQRQSAYARANSDSDTLLSGYLNDQHDSFADAFEHNKALNKDYQNELTPGKSLPFDTVNFAKGNLKSTIENNFKNNPELSPLQQAWQDANKATAEKNSTFNTVVGDTGKDKKSTFYNFTKNPNQIGDASTFVKDYIPNGKAEGTQKMQQFSQMLGDPEKAANTIKLNYFGKAIDGNNVDAKTFLSKYSDLSPEQQGFLFKPQENQAIQALKKIQDMHPDAFSKTSPYKLLWHSSIPFLLGGSAAHALGTNFFEGGLTSAVGAQAAKFGLNKLFENPAIQNYFRNYLTQNAAPAAARSFPAISTPLQSAINPTLMNAIGGR